MSTDIILGAEDGNWVVILAGVTKSTSTDFILDCPARRKPGKTPKYRRAIVHDANDGLTINFNQDYPGGVTVLGVANIIQLKSADRDYVALKTIPNLVVEGGIEFEWHPPIAVGLGPARGKLETVNLQSLISDLLDKISHLTDLVDTLEKK